MCPVFKKSRIESVKYLADRTVFAEKGPVKNRSVGVYHLIETDIAFGPSWKPRGHYIRANV